MEICHLSGPADRHPRPDRILALRPGLSLSALAAEPRPPWSARFASSRPTHGGRPPGRPPCTGSTARCGEHLGHPGDTTADRTLAALATFATTVEKAANRHDQSARRLDRASAVADAAATRFAEATVRVSGNLDLLTQGLSDGIAELLQTFAPFRGLAACVPGLTATLATTQTAAKTFGDVIASLVPAGKSFEDAAAAVKTFAVQIQAQQHHIGTATATLQTAVANFSLTADRLSTAVQAHESGAHSLTRSTGQLEQAVNRLGTVAQQLVDFESKAVRPIQQGFSSLNGTLQQLQGTAADLRTLLNMQQQLQPLLQALARATQVAAEVALLPDRITTALAAMQSTLSASARDSCQALSDEVTATCDAVGKQLQQALNEQVCTLQQVRASIGQLPTEVAASLADLLKHMETFSSNVIEDQANTLETTLEHILGQWHRHNGASGT